MTEYYRPPGPGIAAGTGTTAGARRLRIGAALSLSGRYARFGRQAAAALDVWRDWDGAADLVIEDDRGDPREVAAALRRLASTCDVLLGPYSTHLMRTAGDVAADLDRLLWNHGGSGDDVEAAHPGHVVSVPTPTSRYAEPYVRRLGRNDAPGGRLWLVHGSGGFGRQVVAGAAAAARAAGIEIVRIVPHDLLPAAEPPDEWHLFTAGSYEEDVETVRRVRRAPRPPRTICAVAAGVREFGAAVGDPEGVYGVGQWFPGARDPGTGGTGAGATGGDGSGTGRQGEEGDQREGGQREGRQGEGTGGAFIGPAEADFVAAFERHAGHLPDYPAAQAVAAAVIAAHCTRLAGGTDRERLWAAAAALNTTTLFGAFRIDPESGVQVGHRMAITRWTRTGLASAA